MRDAGRALCVLLLTLIVIQTVHTCAFACAARIETNLRLDSFLSIRTIFLIYTPPSSLFQIKILPTKLLNPFDHDDSHRTMSRLNVVRKILIRNSNLISSLRTEYRRHWKLDAALTVH